MTTVPELRSHRCCHRPRCAPTDRHPSPDRDWPWLLLEWWFLALIADHLLLEHRAHVFGGLPFAAVATILVLVYLLLRRASRAR